MEKLPAHATLFLPEENKRILAVVQIVHGMCEHQKRYAPLARFLNRNGIAVITSDLRGHGDNVTREEELGYFGDNGFMRVLADLHDITAYVKANFPDLPYFLLGHSMGSLISTCYFKKYDNFVDGLFLSGMPGKNPATGVAKFLIRLIASAKGEYYRSPFINNLCNGPFSKAFEAEGSEFAWLSKDKSNVKRYEEDPKCGFVFTLNGFFTLMEFMEGAYTKGSWIMKNKECPVKLMAGADDPVIGGRKSFLSTVEMFRSHGYKNVNYVLYPGQRHEIFNDTERAITTNDMFMDMKQIIESIRENKENPNAKEKARERF